MNTKEALKLFFKLINWADIRDNLTIGKLLQHYLVPLWHFRQYAIALNSIEIKSTAFKYISKRLI